MNVSIIDGLFHFHGKARSIIFHFLFILQQTCPYITMEYILSCSSSKCISCCSYLDDLVHLFRYVLELDQTHILGKCTMYSLLRSYLDDLCDHVIYSNVSRNRIVYRHRTHFRIGLFRQTCVVVLTRIRTGYCSNSYKNMS